MKRQAGIMIVILLGFGLFNVPLVNADSAVGVTPLPAKSQKGDFKGYFNLSVTAKQTEDLSFQISNASNEDKTVDVVVQNATTNTQMQVEYGNRDLKNTSNLPLDLTQAISGPRTVKLAPHSDQVVTYQVRTPHKVFPGLVSGGFTFTERVDEHAEKQVNQTGVMNRYSYVVGLVMTMDDKQIAPKLDMKQVALAQWNDRNALGLTFDAAAGTFIKDLKTEVQVTNVETKQTVKNVKEEQHNIAPYSDFKWIIPLGDHKKWTAGEYLVDVNMHNNQDSWHFKKTLVVSAEDAKEFNDRDASLQTSWPLYLGLIGILLILVITGYLMLKKKRTTV